MDEDEDALYIPKPKRTQSRQKVAGVFGASRTSSDSNNVIPHEFLRKVQFMQKYTDPLKKYIRDCFAQCSNDQAKDRVSSRLIEKINTLSISGGLYNYAWETEPLVSPNEEPPPAPKLNPAPPPQPPQNKSPPPQYGWGAQPNPAFQPQYQWPQPGQWAPPNQYQQWQQPGQYQQWQPYPREGMSQFAPGQPLPPPMYSQGPMPGPGPMPGQGQMKGQMPPPMYSQGQGMGPRISAAWQEPPPAPVLADRGREKKLKKERKAKKMARSDVSIENLVQEKIVGTSTALEKQYLRLTGGSDMSPSNFRPLPVLKKSLEFCLAKFAQNHDYEYISEQLRSIRQDLTVQHITDQLCVDVYETHAKLALEHEDWGNFNQSMNPLEVLYSQNYGEFEHICEIGCYRILYLMGVDDLTGLFTFIPRMKPEVRDSRMVQFAISVWKAACSGEWVRFFNLMKETQWPLCAKVMSIKAEAIRFSALVSVVKAYRQQTLADYKALLFMDSDEEVRKFLEKASVKIPDE